MSRTMRMPACGHCGRTLGAAFLAGSRSRGRRMYMPGDDKDLLKIDEHTVWITVVGVARTLRSKISTVPAHPLAPTISPISATRRRFYVCPQDQLPIPGSVVRALRAESPAWIPTWPVFDIHPMSNASTFPCLPAVLPCFWPTPSVESPVLASLGIYGVLAYLVAQRTRKLVFVSRSAAPGRHSQVVLREGFQLVAIECFWELSAPYPLQKACGQ